MENTPAAEISETTRLLMAWSEGDETAMDRLVPLVDAELRRLARHYLRQERPGHILQTTALVNEAWVRLINWPDVSWQNRAHFIGLAAQLTRRVLVDSARRRQALKYGADAVQVSLAHASNWRRLAACAGSPARATLLVIGSGHTQPITVSPQQSFVPAIASTSGSVPDSGRSLLAPQSCVFAAGAPARVGRKHRPTAAAIR